MTNPRLKYLLRQIVKENKEELQKEKLCLIEDVIKVKKTLWAFGFKQHNEFLIPAHASALFDYLYDLDIQQLKLVYKGYESQVNSHLTAKRATLINQ